MSAPAAADPCDAALVHGVDPGSPLGRHNAAGVLAPADVHAALVLGRLAGEEDPDVLLAAAMAVRAPRLGHVAAALDRLPDVVAAEIGEDVDVAALPWPEPVAWRAAVAASPLTTDGEEPGSADRPLRLVGVDLYLERYWADEGAVGTDLAARAAARPAPDAGSSLEGRLDRLVGPVGATDPDQRRAAATAARRLLTVIAGGPGTGKTTTVARALAALHEDAAAGGRRAPLVALAAPTGRAAARLEEAVRAVAGGLETTADVRARLAGLHGVTLHRLLGARPGSARVRHHAGHRLPHDVVVVDEASMVPLAQMASLLQAVRPDARLVLVGDPDQLVSVEAGAVLADIVGPARDHRGAPPEPGAAPIAGSVITLRTNHRFGGALADLAAAVVAGDADAALAVLGGGDPAATLLALDAEGDGEALRATTTAWASEVVDAARDGDEAAALAALASHRLLCAHRSGPAGVATWNARVEAWLSADHPALAVEGPWYAGRPLLVGANDPVLRLANGDVGVCVAAGGARWVAIGDGRGPARRFGPTRLGRVETVWATTVHKAQGSEHDTVTVLLPPPTSRLLTRQLLYTAVTRARHRLVVAGPPDALRAAIERPVARASGLTRRLWPV